MVKNTWPKSADFYPKKKVNFASYLKQEFVASLFFSL